MNVLQSKLIQNGKRELKTRQSNEKKLEQSN